MRVGPNFPPALAIAPSAPGACVAGGEPWRSDSAADIETYGIAGRIWCVLTDREAAFLLLGYLVHSPPAPFNPPCSVYASRATIVELGAGVGTAGLAVAAQLGPGSTVVLTDLDEVCPLLERNAAALGNPSRAAVRALPWGDHSAAQRVTAEFGPITHVLCSDLVYFPELLAPLLRSLLDLTEHGTQEVIVGYKIRSLVKEQPFWLAFGTWFEFEPVDVLHAGKEWIPYGSRTSHVLAGGGDDAPAEDDYFVFVAHRRRSTLGDAPPRSDAELLLGRRIRDGQLVDADVGADTFELLLLGRSMPL
ncbi:hypothetical protein MCUN1_001302 [Malassezia cuniculi]|uniref:Protein N-lysine methyltransferase METTL21A n=1 Tax=Malassezia cuniculi TaxID=948313 RepID=A0AAF0EQ04_9BASI|nr:hypothetical protein MCUN1_001302 [Malassezia cuniculi]